MIDIILASASPRRHELLAGLGIHFTVNVRSIDECYPPTMPTQQIAEYLAAQKCVPFLPIAPKQLVITADTLVFVDDLVLGKPDNKTHAAQMLRQLSGRAHTVITGVCLATQSGQDF
jgi:septum formation protein